MTSKTKISRKDQLAPIDIMLYNRIKNFTEKGELKFCCEKNKKLSEITQRHQTSISRSLGKLKSLGYITIEKRGLRKLRSTNKKMEVSYFYTKKNVDENAYPNFNEIAYLVDELAKPIDENAYPTLMKSLTLVDENAYHNIQSNIHLLTNILKEKENVIFGEEKVEEKKVGSLLNGFLISHLGEDIFKSWFSNLEIEETEKSICLITNKVFVKE